MQMLELTQAQFLETMMSPMTDVTKTAEPVVDIRPTVRILVDMNLIPRMVEERSLVEAVYRNAIGTYDHVLLPTSRPDKFVCIVVNNNQRSIEGYYVVDIGKEYGVKTSAWWKIWRFIYPAKT